MARLCGLPLKEAVMVALSVSMALMFCDVSHTVFGQAIVKPRILFDESHGPFVWTIEGSKVSFTIRDGFSSLSTSLTSVGFQVDSVKNAPITSGELEGVSVLVVPPSNRHLSSNEENVILDFVHRGGGLLLFGEDSYTGQASLATKFGITPVKAVVCDPVYSLPIRPFHIRIWNMTAHDITRGVGSYIFDWGQPMIVRPPAVPLAYVGNQSWEETDYDGVRQSGEKGGDIAVLAATEYDSGRVVVTADTGGFMNYNAIGWVGLEQFDTRRLALNIFNWLGRQDLFGVSLSYLVSISTDGAQKHSVHVKLAVEHLSTSVLNFTMHRWHDSQYYQMPVTSFSAFDASGMALPVEFGSQGLRRFWTVQVGQATSLNVEYEVILNFVRKDFDQYAGYLSQRFGISEGAGVFVLPQETPIADLKVRFNLPQGWGAHAPWKKADDTTFLPENTKSLMWSTFAVGTFSESSKPIGNTNVRIATYNGWDTRAQQLLVDYSFRAYDYVTRVFGRSVPLETYLTVWVPSAEDGKGICELEWSNSQGVVTSPPPNINYNEYVHRVFHTWNAFDPTGMAMSSDEETWFSEGTNTYYDDKALIQIGVKRDLTVMAYYLEEYLTQYVGTPFDVALTEAHKYADWSSFNKYTWLYYRKGALVSYLLDETIMKLTDGKRSLDDLLKAVYARFGEHKGAVSNADLIQILNSETAFDFNDFFGRYIFGTDMLPLKVQGAGLTVDWPELLRTLKLSRFPLMTLTLSDDSPQVGQTVKVTVQLTTIDGKPIPNQTITLRLNSGPSVSTVVGSATTDESGVATIAFNAQVDLGIYQIIAYYAGSPPFSETSESEVLKVMTFKIDGSGSDWSGFKPIIENPKGTSKLGTPGTNLKAVYAAADAKYLYVMIETWGRPDSGNNFIFPVDLNGDEDWEYSFGFNANSAWWYDLRTVPNGQWTQEMTLDATYTVGDVAEIAIPLEIIGNPTRIDMLVWIYYPSLKTTVDQTGWGAVRFPSTTTAETPMATSTVTSPAPTPIPQMNWVQANWEYVAIVVVIIAIAAVLVARRWRRKK